MGSTLATFLILCVFLFQSVSTSPISAPQNLFNCLSQKGVPTKAASSAGWNSLILPFNLALQYVPIAVTIPTTLQHVSDSVTCASAAGVKVQPKSGGHSYASYSSGGQNGSLIVDLQQFNSISVDKTTFIATVGGGVRLGNLALGIYSQAKRSLSHGTCPNVGVGGHFTHGGYGYGSRRWGLALDTIVAMDVVLANGTLAHITNSTSPQLFFALRGAADSFGIVTNFYLQTVPAPDHVVNFAVSIPAAFSSASTAAQAFLKLQTFAQTSPLMTRDLSFGILSTGSSFSISGWYFGDSTSFTNTILPAMLKGLPAPQTTNVRSLGWLDSLLFFSGGPLAQNLAGDQGHNTFYAKSIVTRESEPLTLQALTSFFQYVINGKNAAHPWFTIINLYGGIDSQIDSKNVSSSAVSDRDALWVFQNYASTSNGLPPFNPQITTFIDGLSDSLTKAQPAGNFGAYLNYVDPDLTPLEAADLYYGAPLYTKLKGIKKLVDPLNVFWNPQTIGNANIN